MGTKYEIYCDNFSKVSEYNSRNIEMLEQYPMQNQMSEKTWKFNKQIDGTIEQTVRNKGPFQVKHMKPHILSDLCIVVKEESLPEVKECTHEGRERQVC